MATSKQIDLCLASLAVSYPVYAKQQTDPALARQIYHRVLSDVDGDLLESATMQWLSTAKPFHPTPGELRELCYTLIKSDAPSAEEAWGIVKKAIRQFGSYRKPEFSSNVIAETVEIMGWIELCMSENEEADRAHFWRIYAQVSERDKRETIMLPAVKNNLQQLKQSKAQELIGNTVKALTAGKR